MKRRVFKALALCMLLAVLAGAMLPASAATKPSIQAQDLWAGGLENAVIMLNWPSDAKVVSVTSSKPDVVKVGKKKGVGPNDMYMKGLKVGKAKVTVKYKLKGKTYSTSRTIAVKAYPKPFAWIKVNGKKVNLTKNKYTVKYTKYTAKKYTITFSLNKNWKVEALNGAHWAGDAATGFKWKKNTAVKMPAKYDKSCAAIDIRNSKTGDFLNYEIWFIR